MHDRCLPHALVAVRCVIAHFASATRDAVATRHLAIHLVAPKTFYERQYSRGYRFVYRRSRAEKVHMDGWMHCAIGHTIAINQTLFSSEI